MRRWSVGAAAENLGEYGAAALDSVGVDREPDGVVRLVDRHGHSVALIGDGYLRMRVAVLQGWLKFADRFVAGHGAALSGRWNLLHLVRVAAALGGPAGSGAVVAPIASTRLRGEVGCLFHRGRGCRW